MSDNSEETESEENKREEAIQKHISEIDALFRQATRRSEFDFILKRFSLKCIKNKKKSSPMALKMDAKKKIIQMAINEPSDTFDYDHWFASTNKKQKTTG